MRVSPWIAGFFVLWLLCEVAAWPQGGLSGTAGTGLQDALEVLLFGGITWWLTKKDGHDRAGAPGRRYAIQLAVLMVFYLGIASTGVAFNLGLSSAWNPFEIVHNSVDSWALAAFHDVAVANGVANTVVDAVLPAAALLLLNVPFRALGFGRFRKSSTAVAILWLIVPLAHFAVDLLQRKMSFAHLLRVWVANFLQNGFPEEAFFRGMLMGRLRVAMGADAALVLQALLFGLMHVGYTLKLSHGSIAGAIELMVVDMSVIGLALGYVTQRTGNIAIATAAHFLGDAGGAWL
jgi:membrane protease YdiL (CAAX protease family)